MWEVDARPMGIDASFFGFTAERDEGSVSQTIAQRTHHWEPQGPAGAISGPST